MKICHYSALTPSWMSDQSAFVPPNDVSLTYDINVDAAQEVPCHVIEEAIAQGKSAAEGVSYSSYGLVKGQTMWGYINDWIQGQGQGIWKVPTDSAGRAVVNKAAMTGYQYAFKSSAVWEGGKPVLKSLSGKGAQSLFAKLASSDAKVLGAQQAARIRFGANAAKSLKVGGRVLIVVGVGLSVYDIYTAHDKAREVVNQAAGWTAAWAGWKWGSKGGAVAGAMVPGAGETGISEAIGYVGGGILGSVTAAIIGSKVATTAYDWVFTPGDPQ
jgi:hypothetical protein